MSSGMHDPLPCEIEPGLECGMDRRGWHLDKGLNPAYIVPLICSILAGLAWAGSINKEQAVQDNKIQAVEKKVDDVILVSREDMKTINAKLDRLIERSK